MQEYIFNAFDLTNLSFRTHADSERVQQACDYAEALYKELNVHGGPGRDRLLAILLLGITDDLLQQKRNNVEMNTALLKMLEKIEIATAKPETT